MVCYRYATGQSCHLVIIRKLIWKKKSEQAIDKASWFAEYMLCERSQIAKFMGLSWGPPGSCRLSLETCLVLLWWHLGNWTCFFLKLRMANKAWDYASWRPCAKWYWMIHWHDIAFLKYLTTTFITLLFKKLHISFYMFSLTYQKVKYQNNQA